MKFSIKDLLLESLTSRMWPRSQVFVFLCLAKTILDVLRAPSWVKTTFFSSYLGDLMSKRATFDISFDYEFIYLYKLQYKKAIAKSNK
jgi:hypothetical protein